MGTEDLERYLENELSQVKLEEDEVRNDSGDNDLVLTDLIEEYKHACRAAMLADMLCFTCHRKDMLPVNEVIHRKQNELADLIYDIKVENRKN